MTSLPLATRMKLIAKDTQTLEDNHNALLGLLVTNGRLTRAGEVLVFDAIERGVPPYRLARLLRITLAEVRKGL